MPPTGISLSAVQDALIDALGEEGANGFWRWFSTTWPEWARAGWGRVDQARVECGGLR